MSCEHYLSRRRLLTAAGATGIGLFGGRICAADPPPPEGAPMDGDVQVPAIAEEHKICQDRFVPDEMRLEALKAAKKEDPKNDVLRLLTDTGELVAPGDVGLGTQRAAIFYAKKWAQKRPLKVGFFGGSVAMRKKVQTYAEKWHEVVNVRFLFNKPGPYEIRISFSPSLGSSSYMGTDNLLIPTNQATMNFGWVTDTSTPASDSAVILHEFGHALGMIHEHQSPGGAIHWNRPVVIAAMWQSAGWSQQQVEQQIFARYSTAQTQYTELDRTSIMMYPFPAGWTTDGVGTPWNTKLSDKDIAFMKLQYPNPA
jgi:serralysin